MRLQPSSSHPATFSARASVGLIVALGTLLSTELVASAQTATPPAAAPTSATPAAAPAAADATPESSTKKTDPTTTTAAPTQPAATPTTTAAPATAPAQAGTDPQKPASDPSVKAPETKTEAKDAAAAKATAETTKPAEPEAAAAPSEEAEKVEKKEAGHAIYVSADFGFTRADVGALSDSTGFSKTGANGLVYGFALGYRHHGLRVGGRFQVNDTTEFNLWSFMAEIGYGLDLRPISPLFALHAGYVFDTRIDRPVLAGALPPGNLLTPDADLHGARIGAEIVGNVWLSEIARIGPFVGFDLTFLNRPKVDLPQSIYPLDDTTKNNALFSGSGSGVGYVFNAGIRGTIDIGF